MIDPRRFRTWGWLFSLALSALLLAGCAGNPPKQADKPTLPEPLVSERDKTGQSRTQTFGLSQAPRQPWEEATPALPPAAPTPYQASRGTPRARGGAADMTLAFDQAPLPAFIETVYGELLKDSYVVDPQVAARKDLVTLRVPEAKTPAEVEDIAAAVLASYGVAVSAVGPDGVRHIQPGTEGDNVLADVQRGRALPDVPAQVRPAFLLVDLEVVRNTDVAGWLRTIYGQQLQVSEDPKRNAVLIGGQADRVAAAAETIRLLDQPLMKGRQSVRINPRYWSAEALARDLVQVLEAEGLSAGTGAGVTSPITVVPIQSINALVLFASGPKLLAHAAAWARKLDAPNAASGGAGISYLTYKAQYTSAEGLAATVRELVSAGGATQPPLAGDTAAAKKPDAVPNPSSRVVVNAVTNTLVIQATGEDQTRLLDLLRALDQPAMAALIEVTVAEVRLSDLTQLGVEWEVDSGNWKIGTTLGVGQGGLTAVYDGGSVRAKLNALASNNRARILSTPRIMARNGTTAKIQVGQQVPIITSSQTNQATGGQGVLQSIEYRDTGIILNVKPVIHSADRIDVEVSQEVSAAQKTTTGVDSSPTFITRKLQTDLTLRDGATIILGGLMQTIGNDTDGGVPILKDIPGVGLLFRNTSKDAEQTELLVVITPYIITSDADAQSVTRAIRDRSAWPTRGSTQSARAR